MPQPVRTVTFAAWLALLACITGMAGCRSLPSSSSQQLLLNSEQDQTLPLPDFEPSNNRDWSPDVAVLPFAEIDGNRVKVHNIRHCAYRADDEFIIKHYDKSFDLDEISTVDFIVVPFKEAQALAHTMLSFGFENGDHLCVSVEARLEKDETYAPLLGAMRQFELMYVLADERDVIVRRTQFRDVDVYLYRTTATAEQARTVFMDVIDRVNKLYREPEFYDTLTNNCTTNLVEHLNHIRPTRIPVWDLRVLLPGYADQLAYELGLLDRSKSFEELRAAALIKDDANRFADRSDFSEQIRR